MQFKTFTFLMAVTACASASAQVTAINSPFTGTDSISWSQFGGTFTNVANPASGTTALGGAFTVSNANGQGQIRQQGNGWNGDFPDNDILFWNQGQGPTTISIPSASEVGAYVQSDVFGVSNIELSAYNGSTLLGTVTLTQDSEPNANHPTFLGLSSTSAITSVVWTADSGNDMAIDTVQFNAVPEPMPMAALGLGVLGLGLARRRSKRA
jgi:hypothetical protein